jgi:hypothetical protein
MNWILLSTRLYRFLLRLYPGHFRIEYGTELLCVFRDACRAGYRRDGIFGLAGVWFETLPDLFVSALGEHAQEEFQMVRNTLNRILALAGLGGGVVWIGSSAWLLMTAPEIPGSLPRQVDDLALAAWLVAGLVSAGLLGLMLHAREWPLLSRLALLLAAAGGLWVIGSSFFTTSIRLSLAGFAGQALGLLLAGLILLRSPVNRGWAIPLLGLAITMSVVSLDDWTALFGVAAGICAMAISLRVFRQGAGWSPQAYQREHKT